MATPFPFTLGQTLTAAQMNAITTLPSTTKTASHTLVIADQGTRVIMNVATANTITVNTSIFGAGDIVEIQNIGAGVCTVTAGTATVSSAGPLAIPQFGGGQLFFTSAGVSIFFPSAVTVTASKIGQVLSTNLATTFTTASTTFTDITGLSVSITPTLATSKVLIFVSMSISANTNITMFVRQMRDSTAINIGDTAGSRTSSSGFLQNPGSIIAYPISWNFLDSPNSTSAITYKVQTRVNSETAFINRTREDDDAATRPRQASTITVMEILA